MQAQHPRTVRVSEPDAFGDMTLAPVGATGISESQLARAMVEALHRAPPESGADALRFLRMLFPSSPLTVRVAALTASIRR
jgi:hypothetical protein